MRLLFAIVLISAVPAAAAGLMPPARLQALVEQFAGRPARVDPRLILPDCTAPALAWGAGGSVVVHCAAPEWRVFVPVAADPAATPASAAVAEAPPATPAIRRGDHVTVEAGGDGFVIGLDTIAEADARDGRVQLRSADGSRRVQGVIDGDGRVWIHGLSGMVNRR